MFDDVDFDDEDVIVMYEFGFIVEFVVCVFEEG